jgi:hypothetical protein
MVCAGDPERAPGERFACICPECDVCTEVGNPKCYPAHGLVMDILQIFGAVNLWKVTLEEIAAEQKFYAEMRTAQSISEIFL